MSLSKIYRGDPSFKPVTLLHVLDFPETAPPAQQENSTSQEPDIPTDQGAPASSLSADAPQPDQAAHPASQLTISEADLEAMRNEAFNKGFAEGQSTSLSELQSATQALASACAQLNQCRATLCHDNRKEIVNLVMTLCRKIVQAELETKEDTISKNLERAMELAISNEEYIITLHPDDLETVEKARPELMTSVRGLEHIIIRPDPALSRGDCILESNSCRVDATIDGQFDKTRRFLEEQLQTPASETGVLLPQDSSTPEPHAD